MTLPTLKACGVLCFREMPAREFLLLRHPDRWDLPKGHTKKHETELECALRELREETGISKKRVSLVPEFRFEIQHEIHSPRLNGSLALKTYVIFVGYVRADVKVVPTEHIEYRWFCWHPPHQISAWLIDPLLQAVEQFWERPV